MFTLGFQNNVFSDVCKTFSLELLNETKFFENTLNICLQMTFFNDVILNVALTF